MERTYTSHQMTELSALRNKILSAGKLSEEQSLILFKWIKELTYANIPNEYWRLSFDGLKVDMVVKKVVREFIIHLDNAVSEGLGISFLGECGIGKTSMMCEIGKAALRRGYSVVYTTLESYIDSVRNKDKNEELLLLYEKTWNSDFILIDEVDKAYIKQGSDWVVKQFTDLIKGTTPYHKVLVTAMNMSESELESTFGSAVRSAMLRHLKFIPVVGEDFSNNLQKDWMSKLKGVGEGYFDKEIIKQALEWYQAASDLSKKKYDEVW